MLSTHEVKFRRIDCIDKKLFLFYMYTRNKLNTVFNVIKSDIRFQLSFGLIDDLPSGSSFIDIQFETNIDADLAIFEKEIPLIGDTEFHTELLKVLSREHIELEKRKEVEREKVESQLKSTFPLALEAVNTFRRACRVALFEGSIALRVLDQSIQISHIRLGIDVDHSLNEHLSESDTEFLFAAFADISLSSFRRDAIIEYTVRNASGYVLTGVFKNGYQVHSVNRFSDKFDEIQRLLDDSWLVETDLILAALEYLYSDNYKMAIFNAATALELIVLRFWEEKKKLIKSGSREEKKQANRLVRKMKAAKKLTQVAKILRYVLPEYVESSLIAEGTIEECVEAWNIRNTRIAHLFKNVRKGERIETTSTEAWNAVVSIINLLEALKILSLDKAS